MEDRERVIFVNGQTHSHPTNLHGVHSRGIRSMLISTVVLRKRCVVCGD